MNKCPCETCISLALCRHKRYLQLFKGCYMIREYEPNYAIRSSRRIEQVYILQDVLKPTMWRLVYDKKYIEDPPLIYEKPHGDEDASMYTLEDGTFKY